MLKDPNSHRELGKNTSLISPVSPSTNFEPGSAPRSNGVPYIVYKRCPQIQRRLWKLLKIVWRGGKITCQWRYSEGNWIPKEEGAKRISQFRCISLLKVEGKFFFNLLNRRLSDYL